MHAKLVTGIAGLLVFASASQAGLVVSSFKATASTNAFAPLDKSAYFDEHTVQNTSPSIVDAAGDWTGTNFGGSVDTWHWVGSAHANTSATSTQSSLSISGNGTFNWSMVTTAQFITPATQTLLYDPGSRTNVSCTFAVDANSVFVLSGVLSRYSRFRLFSVSQNSTVYSKLNTSNVPFTVLVSDVLPPGEYTVGADTGLGGITTVGASNESHTGSFTNFLFTVQAPEPASGLSLFAGHALLLRRRR